MLTGAGLRFPYNGEGCLYPLHLTPAFFAYNIFTPAYIENVQASV